MSMMIRGWLGWTAMSICFASAGWVMADWPQFRGRNGHAVAEGASYPAKFGPGEQMRWAVEMPPGLSSPCVVGDRIFITGVVAEESQLETICLERDSGKVLWRRIAPVEALEKVHQASSPANATPAADDRHVVSYFGSYGLLCYDQTGEEVWKMPLPIPETVQGSGSSPILADGKVLLHRDESKEPCMLAVDCETGETVWKHEYEFPPSMASESYSTPSIYGEQIIVHAHGEVLALSLKDGTKMWSLPVPTNGTSSPEIHDGVAYIGAWSNGGESALQSPVPDLSELVEDFDQSGDGFIQLEEFPDELAFSLRPEAEDAPESQVYLKQFFGMIDGNKNDRLDEDEWAGIRQFQEMAYAKPHGLIAIRLSAALLPADRLIWAERKAVPEVPSPLYINGRVYMVKNGGIVTCLDAGTGKRIFRKRLQAPGSYYASPVAVADKIYLSSNAGVVTVIGTGNDWDVKARNDLGERIWATPAAVDGTLYVRTENHLYAFE